MVCVVLFSSVVTTSQAAASSDVVLEWNALAATTIIGQSAFAQARFAAITQLAVFEAVNAVTGDYQPYLGTIDAPDGASADAAAIAQHAAVTIVVTCGVRNRGWILRPTRAAIRPGSSEQRSSC